MLDPIPSAPVAASAVPTSLLRKVIFVMNTLYSEGGVLHLFKRHLRLGTILGANWSAFKAFDRQLAAHPLVMQYEPVVLFRPLRPYLYAPFNFVRRGAAVMMHFDFLRQLLSTPSAHTHFMARLYTTGFEVLKWQLEQDAVRILLVRSGGLGREGELSLVVYLNDEKIVSSAFSIVSPTLLPLVLPDAVTQVLLIGCLKGHQGQREAIKALTKKMHGLRPRTLLILVHQALLNAWCPEGGVMMGVGTDGHFSIRYTRMRRRVQVNYDEFWQELEGQTLAPGLFLLPSLPQHKPLSEVKSNKRAETQRRRELEQALLTDTRTAFEGLLLSLPK